MKQSRNTSQLKVVTQALHRLANHPTAEEVYECIHQEHPSISKATVYRTLNKLVVQGEARKLSMTSGPDRYDHRVFNHAHIQCSKCGRLSDVMIDVGSGSFDKASSLTGYQVNGVNVQFVGICPQCKQASSHEDA
jgi:Fe2+ or Zn2+ uptake regulation protein